MRDGQPDGRSLWSVFASDEFDRAVTARHLMTPMSHATAVAEETPAQDAAFTLAEHGFDQAPVGIGDGLCGYVLREDLEHRPGRFVREFVKPLVPQILVGLEATVATLLQAFTSAKLLFVVGDNQIAGFITPSDFGRPAVRVHFYLLFADFEMSLAATVRYRFGDGFDALDLLSGHRRDGVVGRHDAAQSLNVDLDYVSDMELSDLITIVGVSADLRGIFGATTRAAWQGRVGRLVDLRNYVMHPTKNDIPRWSDVRELAAAEGRLRGLLTDAREASTSQRLAERGAPATWLSRT